MHIYYIYIKLCETLLWLFGTIYVSDVSDNLRQLTCTKKGVLKNTLKIFPKFKYLRLTPYKVINAFENVRSQGREMIILFDISKMTRAVRLFISSFTTAKLVNEAFKISKDWYSSTPLRS